MTYSLSTIVTILYYSLVFGFWGQVFVNLQVIWQRSMLVLRFSGTYFHSSPKF